MQFRKLKLKKLVLLLVSLMFVGVWEARAQNKTYQPSKERSSFQDRRMSIMDANQLRASYYNYGHAGKSAGTANELQFEYPKNTGRTYMYFMSVMMGAEVQNQLDSTKTFPIVDASNFRTSRTGKSWSLNPILGYFNPDSKEMARSDRGPGSPIGDTWPAYWPDKKENGGDGWPGAWDGYFGKNQFNADLEFFYKAGDDLYTKYLDNSTSQFKPDKTDESRGGLGFILDTRVMSWTQTLVNATHFNIFEMTNTGSYNYKKVAFGLWIADWVGSNASNDQPQFDELRSVAYLTDLNRDNYAPYFDGPIGEMGLKFLETPGNAIDGIDNDGDSDTFNPNDATFYDPAHTDLFTPLTKNDGGFYSQAALVDSVVPTFTAQNFQDRTLRPGDKIVLIGKDESRFITTYPSNGGTLTYDGVTYGPFPPGGETVNEDIFDSSDPRSVNNNNIKDDDFDGLIDENTPNDLEKKTLVGTTFEPHPVRYINYLYFQPGDTVQRGLIVPNRLIRQRMKSDPQFKSLVQDYYEGRFQNYHTSAPMIDEARNDHFDNNDNWKASNDDVGIQGNPDTPSLGQGDGKPTSGAGTNYPGEPDIDKTDVQETDMIGVTNVTIFPAGSLPINLDATLWQQFMVPGHFDTKSTPGTDSDIFVSSSPFPLTKGNSARFSVAVTAVQTMSPTAAGDRKADNANLAQAVKAYDANYQFAVAPTPPKLRAVAGDGYVRLYWDTSSEQSFDRYMARLTGNGYDFEGYRVYRATDAAFQDTKTITDAYGNTQFNRPLVIFDKKDGIEGLMPIPVNGVQYNLGDDSGLQRTYVDTTVTNGQKYYYAVTAFDHGNVMAGISPSESAIQISRNPDGSVVLGQSVVEVRPSPSQAGYITPDNPAPTLVSGSPGGTVNVQIVDPNAVEAGNIYNIVFEDTLVKSGQSGIPDTLKTKDFSFINVSNGKEDTLISKSKSLDGQDNPTVQGLRVTIHNENKLELNQKLSGWVGPKASDVHPYDFAPYGHTKLADYNVIIGDSVGFGHSTAMNVPVSPGSPTKIYVPAEPTNFRVYNIYDGKEIKYAFADLDTTNNGKNRFSAGLVPNPYLPDKKTLKTDGLFLIEDYYGQAGQITYQLQFRPVVQNNQLESINPQAGDTLKIRLSKPFSRKDKYEFKIKPDNTPRVSDSKAKSDLGKVKVVPNPYVVSNPYEPAITPANHQQQHELHFTHIPVPCTLRIFTISGQLVREINIAKGNPRLFGGTYVWDMLTKDHLELSYGVYIYHIDAPGVGQKAGKFAVIK